MKRYLCERTGLFQASRIDASNFAADKCGKGVCNKGGNCDQLLCYLISHPRPIVELLNPRFKDIREDYDKEFKGMSVETVDYDQLIITR